VSTHFLPQLSSTEPGSSPEEGGQISTVDTGSVFTRRRQPGVLPHLRELGFSSIAWLRTSSETEQQELN
jgi:hypothetical protein